MDWAVVVKRRLSFSTIEAGAGFLGSDILIYVKGGSAPHIGCMVQAVPRQSLAEDDAVSATSSVINLPGHKDEAVCRKLAEEVCRAMNVVTVCTGGFHVDGITGAQIKEVLRVTEDIAESLMNGLRMTGSKG